MKPKRIERKRTKGWQTKLVLTVDYHYTKASGIRGISEEILDKRYITGDSQ